MAKYYYLSRMIGDGSFTNPIQPAIKVKFEQLLRADPNMRGACETVIPANAVPGSWCLAIVGTANHLQLQGSPDWIPFPQVTIDNQLSAIDKSKWMGFKTAAQARFGISLDGMFTDTGNSANSLRDVVRTLGKSLQTSFHEDNFDADETKANPNKTT